MKRLVLLLGVIVAITLLSSSCTTTRQCPTYSTIYTPKDIYYVNYQELQITRESGVDLDQFSSVEELTNWLENKTADDTNPYGR